MEKLVQIGSVAAPVRRAGEVGDGRLKALYAVGRNEYQRNTERSENRQSH